MPKCPFAATAIVVLVTSAAGASGDVVFNVAQPLVGYDVGLIIGFEGYAGYGTQWPVGLVLLTCAENSTRILGAGRRGVATENRNAASIVGLTLRHVPKTDFVPGGSEYEPYFGDTLRVVLQIPEDAVELETKRTHGWIDVVLASLRTVVCATVECARINAASLRVGDDRCLGYLAVEVDGWDGAADLAGTYSLKGIAPIADRQHGFNEAGRRIDEVCR